MDDRRTVTRSGKWVGRIDYEWYVEVPLIIRSDVYCVSEFLYDTERLRYVGTTSLSTTGVHRGRDRLKNVSIVTDDLGFLRRKYSHLLRPNSTPPA